MKLRNKAVIFFLGMLLAININAQPLDSTTTNKSTVKIVYGERGHEQHVEDAFMENKPSDKSVAGMPHFAIVGKYKKFYLGIGANFKMSGAFDFGAELPSSLDVVPADMTRPLEGDGAQMRFSAESSSIYLNFVAMPDNPNRTGLFFSGDFKGGDYKFQLSNIYIKYRGLTLGYTDGAFTDNDAVPYLVDDGGAIGKAGKKEITAYWVQNFGKGFSGAIGVDAPVVDLLETANVRTVRQRVPAFPLWLKYTYSRGYLRLAGVLRTLQYRDNISEKNNSLAGWGVQLSGLFTVDKTFPLKFYYGAVYGHGISEYIGDLDELDNDAMPSAVLPGKMNLTRAWSAHVGVEYRFSDKFMANVLYSRAGNYYDKDVAITADYYRYAEYLSANFVYNINYFTKIGLGYNYGYRKSTGGDNLHVNRFQCLFAIEI